MFGAANIGADVGVAAGPNAPVDAAVEEPMATPSSADQAGSETVSHGSPSGTNSDLSLSSNTEQSISHSTEDRALQPHQMGLQADVLGQPNGWHRGDVEHDDDGTNNGDQGPSGNDPSLDGGAADEDWPGVAEDAGEVGEAMNWDRLLGLDGSLAFLEHVLWLIALDTLFIVIFGKYYHNHGAL